ncbi:MAG TPA: hypothetical protein VKZ81_14015 [Pseudonocardia sp.]|uniref:hypothetical protein n=1 Tax=Pseudonocardia sp. TaxID=60912 RepID=UPI002B4B929B|nr:hypothetical protein [Pseudonocardia sp.]HLU56569.1 hypothetical protein [Pseudonocardia sp.]
MDSTTCSVWALAAGSTGGAIGGYCLGRRRRRSGARRAAGAGSRPAVRRRRRSRGAPTMRSWPGGSGHPAPPAGDGEGPAAGER